jgi:hypothetical protein
MTSLKLKPFPTARESRVRTSDDINVLVTSTTFYVVNETNTLN